MNWIYKLGYLNTILAIICFTSFTSSAFSQSFDEIAVGDSGVTYLLDPASISHKNELVTFTQLINYPNGYPSGVSNIRSIRQVRQINCKDEKIKTISMIAYDELNGAGGVSTLSVGRDYPWVAINAGSVTKIIQGAVCK